MAHRDLNHYLSTFDTTDTVGPQLLAEAIYVVWHDPADLEVDGIDQDEVAETLRELPWGPEAHIDSEVARQRLLVEAACAEVVDPGGRGPPSKGRRELADELDVDYRTVTRWLAGETTLEGAARQLVERVAGLKK